MINYFAGIDVQISRGCSYYIIDRNKKFVTNGWVKKDIPKTLKTILSEICSGELETIAIGIDAPRMPIKKLRTRYFDKKNNVWVEKSKKCFGRECEVIIKSHNIANPQWTRTYAESPKWMKLGFEIFSELKDFPFVYEVFPSASYKMFENENVEL